MENRESQKNLIKEVKEAIPNEKLWVKKKNFDFSVMELQDFGKFLMDRKEHCEGNMVCLQMNVKDPLEVRFFSDDPKKEDDVYHIKIDYKTKGFRVVNIQGSFKRINNLLEEFGFIPERQEP